MTLALTVRMLTRTNILRKLGEVCAISCRLFWAALQKKKKVKEKKITGSHEIIQEIMRISINDPVGAVSPFIEYDILNEICTKTAHNNTYYTKQNYYFLNDY